ncbi:hypothetical protein ACH3O9_00480 [Leeuwenhoekiella sp. A16]|uniref:hypothetical protein n=1 Tax=unclassified Leeuwenhoekiella TaxID=2615029 RepID=UPI003A80EB79|tara:strand:+ start:71 stop:634 length:564 start_codon:yes stop_codon:yes gene_type:complete
MNKNYIQVKRNLRLNDLILIVKLTKTVIPTINQYHSKEGSHPSNLLDEILHLKLKPFCPHSYDTLEDRMVSNVKMYQKHFSQPKADLFHKVFVTHDPAFKRTRYFFSAVDVTNHYIQALKNLVNKLYNHFGPDDRGFEEFTNKDKNDILKSGFLWAGRIWKKNLCGYEIVVEAHTTEWVSLLVVVHP